MPNLPYLFFSCWTWRKSFLFSHKFCVLIVIFYNVRPSIKIIGLLFKEQTIKISPALKKQFKQKLIKHVFNANIFLMQKYTYLESLKRKKKFPCSYPLSNCGSRNSKPTIFLSMA
jgi:hypothetical protein